MSPHFSTDLRFSQQQILAPQLQQSLKLLQVPAMELQAMIDRQLISNPTLELYDPNNESDSEDMKSFDPDIQDKENAREERSQTLTSENNDLLINSDTDNPDKVFEKELETLISEDENWKSYYESEDLPRGTVNRTESVSYNERKPNDDSDYEFRMQSIPASRSLVDELREQYLSMDFSLEDHEIFEYIIGSLDKNGFLTETSEEIAEETGFPLNHVKKIIDVFKKFDPPGIGAEDLRECLLIQLERENKKNTQAYVLIDEYFDELLHNRRERIAKGLKITNESLEKIIEEIGHLDPKPGRDLSTGSAIVIKPDIIVTPREDGDYDVITNDNLLPYIRINPKIKNYVKKKAFNKKELSELRNEIREGESFINNLQFRKRTVLAVAEAIVEAQKDFLLEGPMALKPLCMKEIADKVGVHEATVSRTVNDKYMDTPQGIYEMRYFFSSHVENSDGEDISTNAIKAKLKEIIKNEDKKKPLSDAKLAELLKMAGYPVARRTVVKYRKALGILNTRQRKIFV
ncbi:MAG: RNA polymerase sigma-54 factor [Chlamydiae bacterium]|nr:MAG: RNA polymerase sigma-54 factor [Chlamydiota bacterium]